MLIKVINLIIVAVYFMGCGSEQLTNDSFYETPYNFDACNYLKNVDTKKLQAATLESIIDSGTIVVSINDSIETISLAGIEVLSENKIPEQTKKYLLTASDIIERASVAKIYLEKILKIGTSLYLEFDQESKDQNSQKSAYVWLNNTSMLNFLLVRNGYADNKSLGSNKKYGFYGASVCAQYHAYNMWNTKIISDSSALNNIDSDNIPECNTLTCNEALYLLNIKGLAKLDSDRDGIACDRLCIPLDRTDYAISKNKDYYNKFIHISISQASSSQTANSLYGRCAACHGSDGRKNALGKSGIIAGKDKNYLINALKLYQAGTLNKYGFGPLMTGQVKLYSNTEIDSLADYISKL